MTITATQIRAHRLHAHHLNRALPMTEMTRAAGACGLQNTPPGAWETALYNRLDGCTVQALEDALYDKKTLLQAWSYRGAPIVFPTAQSGIFLMPLVAQAGEWPWIYTLGISGALEHLDMRFDDLLARTMEAARYLDGHTVERKEALDRTLAELIRVDLPQDKQALWDNPSMYGNPQRQTVGDAAVSFLLRPCSFASLVVFGRRQGISPTFTSLQNWTGHAPTAIPDAEKKLVRKFLHCYGPATMDAFMKWLGCSSRQAHRLWRTVDGETVPIPLEGKTGFMLAEDMDSLLSAKVDTERLLLLGPHDPYLDLRDRAVILDDPALQKTVWKYVGNPGAILKGGRIIGIWKTKTLRGKLNISMTVWEGIAPGEKRLLKQLGEAYAAFRLLGLENTTIDSMEG